MRPGRAAGGGKRAGRALLAVATALAYAAIPVPSASAAPPSSLQALTESGCYDPTQGNADYEAYGPTDVNVQAGAGKVTVGENRAGTITVFKYPNPSFYNQVKYFALSRDAAGRVSAQFPNEGSFAGIAYRTRAGRGFAWLRDWPSVQRYDSADTAVPVTTYRSPARLGLRLRVTDTDLAMPDGTFVRQLWVKRGRRSPVRGASLVYFENFNPVATRLQYLPIADWCLTQDSDQHAAYDPRARAVVHSWQGTDKASGAATSVAFAFGWDRADAGHQVGGDGRDPATQPSQPPDGFDQASRAPYRLGGDGSADGQATGTLSTRLRFDRRGRAAARLAIGSATNAAAAVHALGSARRTSFKRQMRTVARWWHDWLARTRLPASADRRVVAVAKRTLITVRLAMVPGTGAIVASADTQGPYGEDWIRDGAFINRLLDVNGFADAVTAHNLFYARVQTSADNPSPVRPPGNWTMASYGDGIDGAPIPFEIDETGLGIWALWDHDRFLAGRAASDYLGRVYPAIVRAADFLTQCQDPITGLQCSASEDDNYTPSQSLHGAETVWLGLKSALAAAHATGDKSPRVATWGARLARLDKAIAALYDPATHSYREGNAAGNAYNVDYGDGGWLLWPVEYRPFGDATMLGEAGAVRGALDSSLKGPHGEYEAKALLGLAHAWSHPTPDQAAKLESTLRYMARALTTSTGLFGEAWRRFAGGRPAPVEDMPHVWEHSLFYLAALEIDGSRPYWFQHGDLWRRACRSGTAPPRACR
ncbi:MAG: glucoamylase [Thermoleophilaceae bacterium]|nr:glucoamylase [Thermoleophilaceae bacterium]